MIFGFLVKMENTITIHSYVELHWALFPHKWCVAPEFFVLISSHCSTQIWRMRYGGSWSIYFLLDTMFLFLKTMIIFIGVSIQMTCANFYCRSNKRFVRKKSDEGSKGSYYWAQQLKMYRVNTMTDHLDWHLNMYTPFRCNEQKFILNTL